MFSFVVHLFVLLAIILSEVSASLTETNCLITEYEQVDEVLQNCTDIVIGDLVVPAGKQLMLNIRSGSTLTLRGTISFDQNAWEGPLLGISGANFVIKGEEGSVVDGNGPLYWDGLGIWSNTTKPKFVKIHADNAKFENIKLFNCPKVCVMIRGSNDLTISNWEINNLDGDEGVAPPNKSAHNTDGFTITTTNNLLIENTVVYNQDDCVVITSGQNITVRNMFCHGSHGLSINGEGEVLENVLIANSVITNAENGIRVKTHVGSPPGLLKNITYKDITILDSKYFGIIIQQNYKNLPAGVPNDAPPENNVKIYDFNLINVYGNVQNGAVPVFILCAQDGCFDWNWEDVQVLGAIDNNCTGYIPNGFEC